MRNGWVLMPEALGFEGAFCPQTAHPVPMWWTTGQALVTLCS